MRFPDEALDYGIDQLSTCFDGVTSPDVVKAVHLCCGYPTYLVGMIDLFYKSLVIMRGQKNPKSKKTTAITV